MSQEDSQILANPPPFTPEQVRYIELLGDTDKDPGFSESERKIFARVGVSTVVRRIKFNNETPNLNVRSKPTKSRAS